MKLYFLSRAHKIDIISTRNIISSVPVIVRVGLFIYYIQAENVGDSFVRVIRVIAELCI